jgi:GTPase SAR1 family protein
LGAIVAYEITSR